MLQERLIKRRRITVPNLSAAGLIAETKEKLGLEVLELDELGYRFYDFMNDEAGRTYDVRVWVPNRPVKTSEVRKYFSDLGFDGNTAAFLTWVAKSNPRDYHMSIPSDDSRLYFHRQLRLLCAPGFQHPRPKKRYLALTRVDGAVDGAWREHWRFVGFRPVAGP
jgi:hypothetical protein